MAKLVPGAAVVAKPAPAPKKSGVVCLSSKRPHRQKLILGYGPIGAGKTTLAATASKNFPATIPAAKMVTLSDMLWISIDIDGVASFAHKGIEVPEIDLIQIMSDEEVYKELGFVRPPSIVEAMSAAVEIAAERVAAGETSTIVVDTLSTFDTRLSIFADEVTKGSSNQYAPYKYMLAAHTKVHEGLTRTGADIIYLAHARAVSDEQAAEKKKNQAVLAVGGGYIAPELTGAAPKVYKRDVSLELYVKAFRDPRTKKLKRTVLTEVNDMGAEVKNRYEGILLPEEEPNLRDIFAKIDAARKGK